MVYFAIRRDEMGRVRIVVWPETTFVISTQIPTQMSLARIVSNLQDPIHTGILIEDLNSNLLLNRRAWIQAQIKTHLLINEYNTLIYTSYTQYA